MDIVPAELDITDEDNIHTRLNYVLDKILELIPPEMHDHPMARMLITFTREGKKDIKRLPAEFIEQLCRPLGEAFVWVSDGSMNDLVEEETEENIEDDELAVSHT